MDDIHRVWTEPGVRRYLWDGEEISREKAASVLARSAGYFEDRGFSGSGPCSAKDGES